MALEGKIDEFGAAEIIQLIAQQQKTGSLKLQKGEEKVEIYFEKGELSGTVPQPRIYGEPLGLMLLRAGIITNDILAKALKKQQKTFEFLGHILINEAGVSIEQVHRCLFTQVYETFYSVLQWKDGKYSFEQKDISRAELLPELPPVESIILDALRMIDEWPEIEKLFPVNNMIVLRTDEDCLNRFSDDELIIYGLIDGKSSLEEITDKSLLGMFTAYKILSEMLNEGFIKLEYLKKNGDEKPLTGFSNDGFPIVRSSFLQKNLNYIFYAVLILVAVLCFSIPTGFPSNIVPFLNRGNSGRILIEQYLSFVEQSTDKTKGQIAKLKYGKIQE